MAQLDSLSGIGATVGMLIVAILGVIAVRHYFRTGALKPELIYQDNPANRQVLASVERLSRRFWPTPWLLNAHLQLLALGLKKAFAPQLVYDHVETLVAEDGGTTALYWLGTNLPADTPTLVVLHTITGSPHSMRSFVRDLHRLNGWRVVLCHRRGHGDLPLTSPRFNTMGDTNDLRQQLKLIVARYPQSPLYGAGVSAGSATLVRYLGEQQGDTPFRAVFAYCPGYDISKTFTRSLPFYSRIMAKKLKKQFLVPNAEVLTHLSTYDRIHQADNLHEFHQHLYEFAGFDNYEAYLDAVNPMGLMKHIDIPMLILNAADDPVCAIDNVREHQDGIRELSQTILVVTQRGSHCGYLSGITAKCWAHLLAAEYLLAIHQQGSWSAPAPDESYSESQGLINSMPAASNG